MWILKKSKELLEHLKFPTFNHVTNIKSFDISTLYTAIPHQKLKNRLTSIIRNAFIFKTGNRWYKYFVLGHDETYFVKEHSDSKNKYSEDNIIKVLEFLVDNIFVVFDGKVFQQTVGIPMSTNCALFSPTSFCIHSKRNSYRLCSQRERNSISVQSHLQVHRWCFVHKQPRIWKLSGPDVSCRTWDQHYREHHFRFLYLDLLGWSTSHFHLRQTRWFQFLNHKLSVSK